MSQLKLTIVGDPTPLRNATRQAERSLRSMQATATKASAGINKAFGALGVGIGFATLANGLKQATKAASDDRKAQGLLAQALQNTVGATSEAIAGAEQYIRSTQLSSAVLDDELRPALATAVRATGSLAGGQKLLNTALNVSAGTGKDLGTVTNAISKAFNGNTGALRKLLPSIKDGSNFMEQLDNQFKGASETAANLDPYKRLEVVFAEIQETIGTALLPSLEEFSEYLTSPEGEKNVRQIVDLFVAMGKAISDVTRFLIENITYVKALVGSVVFAKTSWMLLSGAVKVYTVLTKNAVTATKLLRTALITTGIGALVVAVGFLAEGWISASEAKEDYAGISLDSESTQIIPPTPTNADPDYDLWYQLGYKSKADYQAVLNSQAEEAKEIAADEAAEIADAVRKALDSEVSDIQRTAERFRNAVSASFGLFGQDEYSVFNVSYFKAKLTRMVAAAKGFAANLQTILKTPGSQSLVNELIAMGPVEGNIAAKALIASGDLKEIVGLKTSLYETGAQAGAVSAVAGNATYEININKAVVSAQDIIKEIHIYEKKTGKKFLVG